MRMGKISNSAEYRMNEQLQNLPIFRANFWFYKLEEFWIFLIFQFSKIKKKNQIGVSKICNLESS